MTMERSINIHVRILLFSMFLFMCAFFIYVLYMYLSICMVCGFPNLLLSQSDLCKMNALELHLGLLLPVDLTESFREAAMESHHTCRREQIHAKTQFRIYLWLECT